MQGAPPLLERAAGIATVAWQVLFRPSFLACMVNGSMPAVNPPTSSPPTPATR
jgi:hypothetical protein